MSGPQPLDVAWRLVFRLGFPVARVWWRLRGARPEGALVAVYVDRALLLVRSSYQVEWNFPGGGVKRGETPDATARRELAEEIGLVAPRLLPAGEATGICDGWGDTGCTSLNYDWTVCPSCSLTIARSLGRGSHLRRNCAASK